MIWLQVLKALLSLADTVSGYIRDKQLLEAGEHKAISESLKDAISKINKANAARDAVDPDGMLDDPDNRDR